MRLFVCKGMIVDLEKSLCMGVAKGGATEMKDSSFFFMSLGIGDSIGLPNNDKSETPPPIKPGSG